MNNRCGTSGTACDSLVLVLFFKRYVMRFGIACQTSKSLAAPAVSHVTRNLNVSFSAFGARKTRDCEFRLCITDRHCGPPKASG